MSSRVPAEAKRALGLLSAARLRSSEVSTLLRFMKSTNESELYRLLKELEMELWGGDKDKEGGQSSSSSTDEAVADQVVQLLRSDAKLSNPEIVRLINSELLANGRSAVHFESRKSLADWVVRVSRLVGASEMLSIATRIRNKVIHQPRSAWSIDGE